MKIQPSLKERIYKELKDVLNQKIGESKLSIQSTIESRDSDGKSSAGDKHETSRASIQIEIEKLEMQLNRLMVLEKELSSINMAKKYSKVEVGSLVITNQGNYFISVGLGKIDFDNQSSYAISLASPVGQILQNKFVGDTVIFNGREIRVFEIV